MLPVLFTGYMVGSIGIYLISFSRLASAPVFVVLTNVNQSIRITSLMYPAP